MESENTDFLGTGIQFPFTLKGEQMTLAVGSESIRESILIILQTAKGERVMRPDFGCGIHEYIFEENNSTTATLISNSVEEALLEFEPRIEVDAVRAEPDGQDVSRLNIEIDYRLKASNTSKNLVYPFYLENLQS